MIPPALIEQWEERWDRVSERFAELRPDLQPKKVGVYLDMPNFGYDTSVFESPDHPGWWIAKFDGMEVGFCGPDAKKNAEGFIARLKDPGADERIDQALDEKWRPVSEFLRDNVLWPEYNCRENREIMATELKKLKPPITSTKILDMFLQLIEDRKLTPLAAKTDPWRIPVYCVYCKYTCEQVLSGDNPVWTCQNYKCGRIQPQ